MEKEYDLGSSLLGDGMTAIFYDGETIDVGTEIFTDEALTSPAPDDRWVLQDGRTIVVIGGKVTEVITAEAPAAEDMAEVPAPAATPSVDVLEAVKPLFEELRGVIAELSSRLDALENVETVEEESTSDETLSKVKALEEKIELLSNMAGAKSVTSKDDREIKREETNKVILSKIERFKNSTK